MKCPVCEKNNQKSKVYIGSSYSTLMSVPLPYYDEDGVLQRPIDLNIRTIDYNCSNGHYFWVKKQHGKEDRVFLKEENLFNENETKNNT